MVKPQRRSITDLIAHTLKPGEDSAPVPKPAPPKKRKFVNTSIYLPPKGHAAIKTLAFEEGCKPHDLYMEGIDMLLKARGLPPLVSYIDDVVERDEES